MSGDDEVEGADLHLLVGWEDDEFPFDESDTDAGDGAVERNVGDSESGSGGVDGEDIARLGGIDAEGHGDDLDFVGAAFGEEGPDGSVHQSADEGCLG